MCIDHNTDADKISVLGHLFIKIFKQNLWILNIDHLSTELAHHSQPLSWDSCPVSIPSFAHYIYMLIIMSPMSEKVAYVSPVVTSCFMEWRENPMGGRKWLQIIIQLWFSKFDPWGHSISVAWELVRRATSISESEPVGNLFLQSLQVILIQAQIWEPCFYMQNGVWGGMCLWRGKCKENRMKFWQMQTGEHA